MNIKTNKDDLYKLTAVEIYKMILIGGIKKFPVGFWKGPEADKNAMEITKYLLEEILKWSAKDIKKKLSHSTFVEHRLNGMIQKVYNNSPFDAFNAAYPNRFKSWELGVVCRNYWKLENGIEATKWLIEEKLKYLENDICEKISFKVFIENGLGGMLTMLFNSSPYNAINATYPNKFKHWEFSKCPCNYWTVQTGIEATKWLIEEKLKWSDEDIKKHISVNIFMVNGLRGMLEGIYNGSFFQAINSAYPNKFNQWELSSSCPHNYWTAERGIEATKWLIEEKLKWSETDIKKLIRVSTFTVNGLGGMFGIIYGASPFKAINALYPHKFKPWELKQIPKKYWTLESGIKATKWLVEEKLKWSENDMKKKLSRKVFNEHGLTLMLQKCFNKSVSKAITSAYPDSFEINK
jgi:hypothetical protein